MIIAVPHRHVFSRRIIVAGLPCLLAACATSRSDFGEPLGSPERGRYGAIMDGDVEIPALDLAAVDSSLLRQEVAWRGGQRAGAIVVAIAERRLYFVTGPGRALRYAVGVGREEALNFRGAAVIGHKEKWPRWTPTARMIAEIPRYAQYAGGMPGGLDNPLGARALYLYRDGRDTYFRLHGTNEPDSIGTAVSSGCIRLFNHDIIDLYDRAPLGTAVTVTA